MKKPSLRVLTELFLLVGIVFYIVWDCVAISEGGLEATISDVTLWFLWGHPGVACILGCLIGHLTWPRGHVLKGGWAVAIPALTGCLLLAGDFFSWVPPMPPVLPVLVGLGIGHFAWPQHERATASAAA